MIIKHLKTAKIFKISSLYAELSRLEFEAANVEKFIALYLWRVCGGIDPYRKIIFIIFHWQWTSSSLEGPYKHYQDYLTYTWFVLAQLIGPPHNQHCELMRSILWTNTWEIYQVKRKIFKCLSNLLKKTNKKIRWLLKVCITFIKPWLEL